MSLGWLINSQGLNHMNIRFHWDWYHIKLTRRS